ncbi:ionotropic receptor 75a-like [Epargyreus clarus]|uniref:ionotropic receptor 75a-like n=1 Tax=Epargyreus clarus TaxID=520877 RepID=UPI003C2CC371
MTLREMNVTFNVRTLYDCGYIEDYKEISELDPNWKQTMYGCQVLQILQDMYKFNMNYMIPDTQSLPEEERGFSIYPQSNDGIDIYAKPIGFNKQMLETACPIQAIFTWRYGFILKRPYTSVLRKFYSLPFTRPVWNCLYLMVLMASVIFFYLSRWERRIIGGYSSYHYELLLAVGACCQHILPLQANMTSRRMAYLSFIMFTYVLYSFYTSNLLSHLVSDKDNSMDLEMLAKSDYECAKLGNLNLPFKFKVCSIVQEKLSQAKYVNMNDGLNAVLTTRTALLADYMTVYPVLANMFHTDDVCQLIEIDLYSNIKKYFYTSKDFSYKEEFKIGILRMKETGILQKLLHEDILPILNCANTYPMSAEFEQIIMPLCTLLGSCVGATVIMIIERWHYRRNKVWPYVN